MAQDLVVYAVSESARDRAQSLSHRLDLKLINHLHPFEFALLVSDDDLSLRHQEFSVPFKVDFIEGRIAQRLTRGLNKRDAIVKALSVNRSQSQHILDATAGFGRDAMLLACHGQQISMIERHPVIHALLADGLRRALNHPAFVQRFAPPKLDYGCATQYQSNRTANIEIIYLDPMYPPAPKKLKVKKETQILHLLTRHSCALATDEKLLDWALMTASKRVVVKRPNWAAALGGRAPTTVIRHPTTRYDIYLI